MDSIKRDCLARLPYHWIRVVSCGVLFMVILASSPHAALARSHAIEDGIAWLTFNQNPSGSWGDPNLTEFRDTTVVADILAKLKGTGTQYLKAISFIDSFSPRNHDDLARKTAVLAKEGFDTSQLLDELLASQNPEKKSHFVNSPEGGWGAAQGYATNNLDTALLLDALDAARRSRGYAVFDETIEMGQTDEFEFELPEGATSIAIVITDLSGELDLRIRAGAAPTLSDPYHHITFAPVNLSDLPGEPGTNYIRVDGIASSIYSFVLSYDVNRFDTNSILTAVNYFVASQNEDGGWGLSKGSDSNVYLTSRVLITIDRYAAYFDLVAAITGGIAWLKDQQNPDGGFGRDGSTVYESALSCIAMTHAGLSSVEAQNAVNYVVSNQKTNGSWNDNAYETAVSLWALWASMKRFDTDDDGVPDTEDNCPSNYNFDQSDVDEDGAGDVCDADSDGDGVPNIADNCQLVGNPDQADVNLDGYGDACTVEHRVVTSAELQDALNVAASNGRDDVICLAQGTYAIWENNNTGFNYKSNEPNRIIIRGGYTLNCSGRDVNPSNTILDGGGLGEVIVLEDLSHSPHVELVVEGVTIQNGQSGSGIMAQTNSGKIILANNNIINNLADHYAGVSVSSDSGEIILSNNIVAGNTATNYGAGISVTTTNGHIYLINNTIAGNAVSSDWGHGAGIYLWMGGGSSVADIYNNIIWGNSASDGGEIYINFRSVDVTINAYNNNFNPEDVTGTLTHAGDNINAEPMFVDAAGDDYHLAFGSPCIDAGGSLAPLLSEIDFEGVDRVLGVAADIGAHEYYDRGTTYILSGQVTSQGAGLAGITVDLGGDGTITRMTDEGGFYRFTWLPQGNYTITPSDAYYEFTPTEISLLALDSELSDQNFMATAKDTDGDGMADIQDNCPEVNNPNRSDTDEDGAGDACDADSDDDGVPNFADNCPLVANPDQADVNLDGYGDACTVDHCVATSSELQDALNVAERNGMDDVICLVQGTYGISENNSKEYEYISSEQRRLVIRGGYTPNCSAREADSSSTILDGERLGGVLSLNDLSDSPFAEFIVEGVIIQNGQSKSALKAYTRNGKITLANSTITSNTADYDAGIDVESSYGKIILRNNAVLSNTATSWQSGIYAFSKHGEIIVNSNVIARNTATHWTAGISANTTDGSIHLINNTIVGNVVSSGHGAGISLWMENELSAVDMYNNIIQDNSASYEGEIYISPWSAAATVFAYNNNFNPEKFTGTFTRASGNINADPVFVNAAAGDYRLTFGSPCIESGKNVPSLFFETDFEGDERVLGVAVDIGADEYYPSGPTYTLSGQISWDGVGLAGIIVNLTGDATLTWKTDEAGYYRFTWLHPGSYTVTPSSSLYDFMPSHIFVAVMDSDLVNQNINSIGKKGDINGNHTLDLKDAILALQSLAIIGPASVIYKGADVNGDRKIGLAEVTYILQKVSDLRQ